MFMYCSPHTSAFYRVPVDFVFGVSFSYFISDLQGQLSRTNGGLQKLQDETVAKLHETVAESSKTLNAVKNIVLDLRFAHFHKEELDEGSYSNRNRNSATIDNENIKCRAGACAHLRHPAGPARPARTAWLGHNVPLNAHANVNVNGNGNCGRPLSYERTPWCY